MDPWKIPYLLFSVHAEISMGTKVVRHVMNFHNTKIIKITIMKYWIDLKYYQPVLMIYEVSKNLEIILFYQHFDVRGVLEKYPTHWSETQW